MSLTRNLFQAEADNHHVDFDFFDFDQHHQTDHHHQYNHAAAEADHHAVPNRDETHSAGRM